jgi:two-component system sensor histidine kinase UhpB
MSQESPNLHPRSRNQTRKWHKFSVQVIALVFLPLSVLVLVVALVSTSIHQNAMRRLVGERDERAARTVADAINAQLLHRADLIQGLAIRGRESTSLDEVLESSEYLDQEFDMGLAFLSPEKTLIVTRGDIRNWETLLEVAIQPPVEEEFEPGSSLWFTKAVRFPNSDNFIVLVHADLGPSGPGAVGAFTVPSVAHQSLSSVFNPGKHSTTFLVDSDQEIIYSLGKTNPEHINKSHPGIIETLKGESGTAYFPVNGSEHVTAYSSVPLVKWGVVIEEPWTSVTNPLLDTTLLAPLVIVPLSILALIALWFGARRVVQPLQSLEEQAARVAWGDYEAIKQPVEGIEEINRLQHTLIHMAHKVKIAQQALRGYISAITTGQEEERQRLARELHDDTIQSLIALKQRVQLADINQSGRTAADQLQEIQDMADQTINDLRRITRDLRPLYLEDLGLMPALEMLARETSHHIKIPIHFKSQGNERRFKPEVELTLYRMAQEALSNVARHSGASQASIRVEFDPQTVTLIITDDGQGFLVPENPAEFAPSGHYGLLGMQERADLIGANLEIHSAPQEGTRLVITLQSAHVKKLTE